RKPLLFFRQFCETPSTSVQSGYRKRVEIAGIQNLSGLQSLLPAASIAGRNLLGRAFMQRCSGGKKGLHREYYSIYFSFTRIFHQIGLMLLSMPTVLASLWMPEFCRSRTAKSDRWFVATLWGACIFSVTHQGSNPISCTSGGIQI